MQNEKQAPAAPRRGIRRYWQQSLLLLVFPTFHGDWVHKAPPYSEEPRPAALALPNAHAHNDYAHERPLCEALAKGFTSIEADVHLVGGELYLGHWLPQISADRTLQQLYLKPLHDLVSRQGGKVYPGYEGIFYLMIDIKTDSLATYRALRSLLLKFPAFQCNPHFQVFISGNRALQHILSDGEQIAAVDGRLSDLWKNRPSEAMPVISDNFRKHFRWRGKGPMPPVEKDKLRRLADEAHRQGKKLRFWAIPDQPNGWQALLEAGVDFISTDDLAGAGAFLEKRQQPDIATSCVQAEDGQSTKSVLPPEIPVR
jgi:hypothetical protein